MWYMSYRPVRSTFLRQKPAVEPSICLCICICVLANMSYVPSSTINIYWAETSCGGTQSLSLKRKISDFSCGSVNIEHWWTLQLCNLKLPLRIFLWWQHCNFKCRIFKMEACLFDQKMLNLILFDEKCPCQPSSRITRSCAQQKERWETCSLSQQ